ncbi:SusC/RagA family TonB-linked outer membrane protein [Pedobacter sp. WC2501]|uniref:SusC/RagA family TonB-linked outer membrane protein n=1 Tax=Pedobacter sp. WC2501 TaxID=3461400 RepID=UPI004045AF1C
MKIPVTILIITCTTIFTLLSNRSIGQNLKSPKISLKAKDKSMSAVLAEIEHASGVHFVYESKLFENTSVRNLEVKQRSVDDILVDLLLPRGLAYRQIGDNIIIEKVPAGNSQAKRKEIKSGMVIPVILHGKVTDDKGEALSGVTVVVKGTTKSTFTNTGGIFSIQAKVGQILVFKFIGYKNEEFAIKGNQVINLSLHIEASQLTDMVVIGYGQQRRGDVTTAISSLKAEDVNNFTGTGVDKAMTGKMAGVQVTEPDGSPGAGIAIAIRGKATITAGTTPLYVIDGIPLSEQNANGPGISENPLNAINLADIESIDVLKDASAAAIYGSRGSNGVVIITTKKGKKGKPIVSYNGYYGIAKVQNKLAMMDAYGYAKLVYDAHNNTYFDLLEDKGLTGSATDDNATRLAKLGGSLGASTFSPVVLPYIAGTPGLTNTDWQDAIFRNAPIENHTISVSGGTDNTKYYVSSNYLDQNGTVIKTGYKRYGSRISFEGTFNKFKIGTTINYSFEQYQFQPTGGRFLSGENIVSIALSYSPFYPVYNPDGSYNYSQYNNQDGAAQVINPVALANLKQDNTNQGKFLGNVYAQYQFTPSFSDKISFGSTINNGNRNTFRPSTLPTVTPSSPTSIPSAGYYNTTLVNWLAENTLSYNKRFNGHSISAIAVVSTQRENTSALSIAATGFANNLVTTLNGATAITSYTGNAQEWDLLSALARVQYNYKGKYLASAAMRTDGSSRFGSNSKYGSFPSASIGWNVDQEPFMQKQKVISSMKLRASYGLTGNNQIGNYAALSTLAPANYVFGTGTGTGLSNGYYQNIPGNDKLGWEQTAAFDVGADISLFKNRLQLTVDAYSNNTSNMLLSVPVPQSSGYNSNLVNIGKLNNKGLEFTLSSDAKLGGFRLNNSANISFNRNKVVDLGGQQSILTQSQVLYFLTEVGQPIGNYYTLIKTGIYTDPAQLTQAPIVPGAKLGDQMFKDINGDGKIDGTNDLAIAGNYQPKFTYGYSTRVQFKALDLGASLQGVYGNQIANINTRYINSEASFTNNLAEGLGRYESPDNPGDGIHERANRTTRGLNANVSSFYIGSGSYLRIRDITLGVTLPKPLIKHAGFSNVRFYFSATNPFLFTKYNDYNPEVSQDPNPLNPGVDYGTYPLSKSFVFGLNLSL